MLELDHIVVAARRLDEGVAWVEQSLGVQMSGGGEHPLFGTHNRLLRLGAAYLEVIAINPVAPAPKRPRWFGLDVFSGPPRLVSWVLRSDDLHRDLDSSPVETGEVLALQRGDLRWSMTCSASGVQPLGNSYPPILEWQGCPAFERLPQTDCHLQRLTLQHPQAAQLSAALEPNFQDDRVLIRPGAVASLQAEIQTPQGVRVLM
ncbi:MAG: polyphosphate kinase [Rhodobacterales bacterium]|nr:MAG: polyphosphate kinase [Rhodobacterales bacterium]